MNRLIAILAIVTILGASGLARAMQLPGPLDYLEADRAVYEAGGIWQLEGNIILHLESLLPDTPLEVRAEQMLYDEAKHKVRVPGALTIALTTYDLSLSGQDLTLDLEQGQGELADVQAQVTFDSSLLADETGLVNQQFVRLGAGRQPRLLLSGEKVLLARDTEGHSLLTFDHARLVTSSSTEPDLVFQLQRLLFSPGRFTSFTNLRVTASGITILYLPRWKQRHRKGIGVVNGSMPLPGRDSEDGWYVQQATFADYGSLHADLYSRYYFDHGLRSEGFFFTDPSANSRLGVTVGRSRSKDFYEHSVDRTTYYDVSWRLRRHPQGSPVGLLDFGINYGRLKQDAPGVTSNRGYGFVTATTRPVELASNLRLIGSVGVHYWNYTYGENEFLAFKHRIKLAHATSVGLDYVQFVHADKFGASPFRFENNFPENELSFQKNFQPLSEFAARLSGRYNYDRERFDSLTAGVSHEFRSYWAGLSYDFARGSIGIEAAIRF